MLFQKFFQNFPQAMSEINKSKYIVQQGFPGDVSPFPVKKGTDFPGSEFELHSSNSIKAHSHCVFFLIATAICFAHNGLVKSW